MKRFGEKELRTALTNGAIIRAWDWYTASAGYRVIINGEGAGYIVSDLFFKLLDDGTIIKSRYAHSYTDYSATPDETEQEQEQQPEKTEQEKTDRENREHCKYIAEEIESYAAGNMYRCPECGEEIEIEDLDEITAETENGETRYMLPCTCVTEYEPEQLGLYDYFKDVLDIEYRVDSDRKTLRSVSLMVACGGPNIYIDTATKNVELYWWGDRANYPLSYEVCDEINEWAQELWNC
jgi:hypothetical protein